jgi:uncharacterized protein YuzE
MRMTYNRDAGTGYLHVGTGTVADSWPLDGHGTGLDIVVDLDDHQNVVGVELLGARGGGPEPILAAIASGAAYDAAASQGFDVPALRHDPTVTYEYAGPTSAAEPAPDLAAA